MVPEVGLFVLLVCECLIEEERVDMTRGRARQEERCREQARLLLSQAYHAQGLRCPARAPLTWKQLFRVPAQPIRQTAQTPIELCNPMRPLVRAPWLLMMVTFSPPTPLLVRTSDCPHTPVS